MLVRYGEHHNPMAGWVYNRADIDAAKVVWANEMSPAENQELLQYYHDRRVWLAKPDDFQEQLVPYPMTGQAISVRGTAQ